MTSCVVTSSATVEHTQPTSILLAFPQGDHKQPVNMPSPSSPTAAQKDARNGDSSQPTIITSLEDRLVSLEAQIQALTENGQSGPDRREDPSYHLSPPSGKPDGVKPPLHNKFRGPPSLPVEEYRPYPGPPPSSYPPPPRPSSFPPPRPRHVPPPRYTMRRRSRGSMRSRSGSPSPRRRRDVRVEELDLSLNHVPFDGRANWTKSIDKTHVLDIAMEPVRWRKGADTTDNTEGTEKAKPVRLAINSFHLWRELSNITKQDINIDQHVLLPPWKSLMIYREEINERIVELEKISADNDVKKAEAEAEDPKASSIGGEETQEVTSNEAGAIVDPESEESPALDLEPAEVVDRTTDGDDETVNPPEPPVMDTASEKDDDERSDVSVPMKRCEICDKMHDSEVECLKYTIAHLKCLQEFINVDLKDVIALRESLRAGTETELAFDDLWHLFNPGDVVISDDPQRAHKVFHVSGGRKCISKPKSFQKRPFVTPFRIDAFSVDFDQKILGPIHDTLRVFEYEGKRKITSLPCYPITYVEDETKTRDYLIKRGKRLREITPYSHKHYQGRSSVVNPEQLNSDIIIDYEIETNLPRVGSFATVDQDSREVCEGCHHFIPSYANDNGPPVFHPPPCKCWATVNDSCIDDERASRAQEDPYLLSVLDTKDAKLTDEHLLLMPAVINGFALRERDWFGIYVDLIQDLEGDKTDDPKVLRTKSGFEDLVLPEGHGDLVEALVKMHRSTRNPDLGDKKVQVDLIDGKGEGLIILLHGVPGVGKTSTAECVAQLCRRPLYPITCANIGLNPEEVEKNLLGPLGHFRKAQQWNCIVLLDEADVFLAKRKTDDQDSDRNALVSVFLRTLEYYPGILILTTNRVGSFDEAFVSRIQLFLYYPPLDEDKTMKVWRVNINRVRASEMVSIEDEDEDAIMSFAKEEYSKGRRWNGRQIRNYFQTAISLSEYDTSKRHLARIEQGSRPAGSAPPKPRLTDANLRKVSAATGKFIDYINSSLPDSSYAEQQRAEGTRNDAFVEK